MNEILSQLYASAAFLLALFYGLDKVARKDVKLVVAEAIRGTAKPLDWLSNMVGSFALGLDALFGKKHLSLRSFALSVVVTLFNLACSAVILATVAPSVLEQFLFDFNRADAALQAYLAAILALCCLSDFLSLAESRLMIRLAASKNIVHICIPVLLMDIAASALIFTTIFSGVFTLTTLWGGVVVLPHIHLATDFSVLSYVDAATGRLKDSAGLFGLFGTYLSFFLTASLEALENIYLSMDLLRLPADLIGVTETDEMIRARVRATTLLPAGSYYTTTFLTSIWLWIYVIGALAVRLTYGLKHMLSTKISRFIDLDEYPFSVVGIGAALVVGVTIAISTVALKAASALG